ncbi:MAG: DUF4932 domain-containing protein, partial [Paludibacter sp.]|nr:DUF4932 domain-containing protein [Paludibacter sp.]
FAQFENHELIKYIKIIRERDSIAYNAVAATVAFLQIRNGKVELAKNADINCLLQDSRWKYETFTSFVKKLNKFYQDTKFKSFFNQHKALYAETEKRFDEFLSGINTEWFQKFFGTPLNNPIIYVSLLNGTSNYGGKVFCSEESPGYISVGCTQVDNDGIPAFQYNFDLLYTIVHELCHIYTNSLSIKYENSLSESGKIIFPFVKEKLEKVAYGDAKTMLAEGFNNLCTNMYCMENNFPFSKYNIRDNEEYGFIWMRRAVKFMDDFYANRSLYPYITDFMPQYIEFINFTAKHIEQIAFEYEHSNPYVVNVFPAINSTVSVDTKEIRIQFSCSMWSSYGIDNSEDSTLLIPSMQEKAFWNDEKNILIIPVKLESEKNYGLALRADVFQSFDTFPMKENFEIKFNTEK